MRVVWLGALVMAACVPRAVNERLGALEARVAQLETQRPSAAADEMDVLEPLLLASQEALATGDTEAARAALQQILEQAPRGRAGDYARRTLEELAVVGRTVTDMSPIQTWYQGQADLSEGRHLVVFFETWCPHCRREVPMIDERLAGRDASALLLTRRSRDTTDEQIITFLADNEVTVPAAYESGGLADAFGVSGVPAAAVVEDGIIIWRGHPGQLEGVLLDRVLPVSP